MSNSSKSAGPFSWRFWIVTLSALAMAGLTFGLGIWQLDRAAQKEKISQERRSAQPVSLNGQWAVAKTVYVDNRQMTVKGLSKQGFVVVTPLITASNEYVLIERGWIPRDFTDRKKLQPIETLSGNVAIDVRRTDDSAQLFAPTFLGTDAGSFTEYPIVPYIDLPSFAKAFPEKVYNGMARQIGSASEGLKRDWYEPASGVEKHYGYAFQWFALCALLIGLYIWFQWIKK